jgi:hypothetical protein
VLVGFGVAVAEGIRVAVGSGGPKTEQLLSKINTKANMMIFERLIFIILSP